MERKNFRVSSIRSFFRGIRSTTNPRRIPNFCLSIQEVVSVFIVPVFVVRAVYTKEEVVRFEGCRYYA